MKIEEIKIDSKAKFIREYMNDHNGETPRWLRGIFMDEGEKIEAILDCMDNIESKLQSEKDEGIKIGIDQTKEEAGRRLLGLLKRLKLECDVIVCDCGERVRDWDIAELINSMIRDLKSLDKNEK